MLAFYKLFFCSGCEEISCCLEASKAMLDSSGAHAAGHAAMSAVAESTRKRTLAGGKRSDSSGAAQNRLCRLFLTLRYLVRGQGCDERKDNTKRGRALFDWPLNLFLVARMSWTCCACGTVLITRSDTLHQNCGYCGDSRNQHFSNVNFHYAPSALRGSRGMQDFFRRKGPSTVPMMSEVFRQ